MEEITITIGQNIYYREGEYAVEGRVTAVNELLEIVEVAPLEGLIKFKKWISVEDILSEDEIDFS
jgi:hypothetical protein